MKPPIPVCKALVVCSRIDQQKGEFSLINLARRVISRLYPAGQRLGIYACWTSAHGNYLVEVQLQTMEGEVVWREGPPEEWPMPNPLEDYDLKLHLTVVFPKPGTYQFVLLANNAEIARQRFVADLAPQTEERR